MLEPVGPLTSKVYWIRRAAVLAVALIVVLLLVWIVGGKGGADATPTANTTAKSVAPLTGVLATQSSNSSDSGTVPTDSMFPEAASIASAASAASASNSAVTDPSPTPSADPAAGTQLTTSEAATSVAGDPVAESAAAQSAADAAAAQVAAQAAAQSAADQAAAQVAADAAAQSAADQAAAQAAADAARPRDPDGRLICPDSSMKLTATVGSPTYNVGQQPIVGVTVVNTGTEACVRDLSGGQQDYLAYDAAGTRIWSTNDCLPGKGTDIRLMNPGDSLQYNIKWSGRTSQPGCVGERTTVVAGTYTVEVHIGTLVSSQTQLTFK